jgi:hypothetical protein
MNRDFLPVFLASCLWLAARVVGLIARFTQQG